MFYEHCHLFSNIAIENPDLTSSSVQTILSTALGLRDHPMEHLPDSTLLTQCFMTRID